MARYGYVGQQAPGVDYTPYLMKGMDQGMELGFQSGMAGWKRAQDRADVKEERSWKERLMAEERAREQQKNQAQLSVMETFFQNPKAGAGLAQGLLENPGAVPEGAQGPAPPLMQGPQAQQQQKLLGPLAVASQTQPFADDGAMMQAIQEAQKFGYVDADFLAGLQQMKLNQHKSYLAEQQNQIALGNLRARERELAAEMKDEEHASWMEEVKHNRLLQEQAAKEKRQALEDSIGHIRYQSGRLDDMMRGIAGTPAGTEINQIMQGGGIPEPGTDDYMALTPEAKRFLQSPLTRTPLNWSIVGPGIEQALYEKEIPPNYLEQHRDLQEGRTIEAFAKHHPGKQREIFGRLRSMGLVDESGKPAEGITQQQVNDALDKVMMEDYSSLSSMLGVGRGTPIMDPNSIISRTLEGKTVEEAEESNVATRAKNAFGGGEQAATELYETISGGNMRYGTDIDPLMQELESLGYSREAGHLAALQAQKRNDMQRKLAREKRGVRDPADPTGGYAFPGGVSWNPFNKAEMMGMRKLQQSLGL